jgi:deazaflavin-dependent oxidoreductase (nitroreductase family)
MTGKYRRPGRFTVHVLNPLLSRLGAAATLEVVRRKTGTLQRVPVNVLDLAGHRYLVSMRGQAHWVRNLRAAGRCVLRERGRRRTYAAVELSGDERASVITAYLGRWRVQSFFTDLPDPADHPVFCLDPAET